MDLETHVGGIGALSDPTRRGLYEYVVAQPDAVGREAAAAELGLAVSTAGFHLDKLVGEGLLTTEFRRLTGRTGPGAGRPSKLYRRSEREFAVSLPPRRYDLVGEILAAAVDRAAAGEGLEDALAKSASEEGVGLGGQARAAGSSADLAGLAAVLDVQGYEARLTAGPAEPLADLSEGGKDSGRADVELSNCPFDALARRHTDLVCGLNLHFVEGVATGLGCAGARARLEPEPGKCCVKVSAHD